MNYEKRYRPGHPMAGVTGLLTAHREVLFDAIGPGAHPCHWCHGEVRWVKRGPGPRHPQELVVDHLDGDPLHNELSNLVPSCFDCNVARGQNRVQDGEVFLVRKNGTRLRGIETSCQQCGTGFVYAPTVTDGKYCSTKCQNLDRQHDECAEGHPMTGDNLYLWNNQRGCKTCRRAASARQNIRRREARRTMRRE